MASNVLTVDLSGYLTTPAANAILSSDQPKITTFTSPILYTSNTLSFDITLSNLTNYYAKTTPDAT